MIWMADRRVILCCSYVKGREIVSMNSFDCRFALGFKSCWSEFWFAGSGTLTCDYTLGILLLEYIGFDDIL